MRAPRDDTAVCRQARVKRWRVQHFGNSPGHVEPAAELMDVVRGFHDSGDSFVLASCLPCIQQRLVGREQAGLHRLGGTDCADVARVTQCIGIVVRHVQRDTLPQRSARRGDGGRR
jgi:hypothetical protein